MPPKHGSQFWSARATVSYARSLPRIKATWREVLIAYHMYGRDLPQEHGYPVQAIVPGHYRMASVKWLTRIHVAREPFPGYSQTTVAKPGPRQNSWSLFNGLHLYFVLTTKWKHS
jgi:DMSO/TMAO reductase YedYZ molybdopterin-dependent catalytic subunit